jgi:hypothetical protein
METDLMLMLAAILVLGSGATLAIFMNSLWDDSKLLTYIDLDKDSDAGQDIDDYADDIIPTHYAL